MAQNGAMDADRRNAADAARVNAKDNTNTAANGAGNGAVGNGSGTPLQGANADLLMNMMNCVDTSLFSPQQLSSWEQMKQRIRAAVDQNVPLIVPTSISEHLAKNTTASSSSGGSSTTSSGDGHAGVSGGNVDFRQPLHREASIQDVLSCLLDQQPLSMRVIASNGGNVLVNSELKNRQSGGAQSEDHRPTLKSLLSSNDFTMTEKKESLKHLLSFIDNSFASHPEPMTDVYKESQDGNMRRLSSLHMMRSFLTPNTNMPSMGGRTTSFEIIQSMLNATTNQTIQKPMTSQDSFRFQHLANVLEAIEGDVGYDNEDYGGEEVVQVDNLDNLLDYQSPTHAQQQQQQQSHHGASSGGFVDTQSMVNQSSRLSGGIAGGYANDYASGGYQNMYGGQHLYGNSAQLPAYGTTHHQNAAEMANMMYANVKVEPTASHQHHQSMMSHDSMQQSAQPPYGHMSFQSAMLAAQPDMMMGGTPSAYHSQQTASMMKPASMQHQQYSAMLMQQQQQQLQQLQHQQTPMHGQAASLVKQQKQDAHGGVQICSALGCNHVARVKGMCKLHGGGRRCKVEGCMKSAQTGHLCIAHGGGKPCNVEGCPKTAQSRGLCKQHGGGVRCKFEGCTKSCQSGGYCRGHGGGKRCEFPNCTKWAQKNGHCAKHAQEITQHHP